MTAIARLLCLFLAVAAPCADAAPATSPQEVRPLLLGSALPDAGLRDLDGKPVRLREVADGKPLVLVFYRGGWCPYCNLQLSELRKLGVPLGELGYRIVAISPDRPEALRETLDGKSLDYTLLSDSRAEAIEALGIGFRVDDATLAKYAEYGVDLEAASGETHHVLPVPSVFVVDAAGVIQFHYVNPDYRIRVPADLLLAAARSALAIKPLK